jgi:hypothetical protein
VKREAVNHPHHYSHGRAIEPIAAIDDWGLGFCLGNTVKYISRAGRKNGADPVEDLRKARWYLDHEIERLTKLRGKR